MIDRDADPPVPLQARLQPVRPKTEPPPRIACVPHWRLIGAFISVDTPQTFANPPHRPRQQRTVPRSQAISGHRLLRARNSNCRARWESHSTFPSTVAMIMPRSSLSTQE